MTTEFSFIDDLGPDKIIEIYDPATRLKAILVVDNVAAFLAGRPQNVVNCLP